MSMGYPWPPRPQDHSPDKTGAPDEPWLTRESIGYLEKTLRPTDKVLEYGMGGSTVWFSRRVLRIDSIEHDYGWFDLVTKAVQLEQLVNVGLYHVPSNNDYEEYVRFGVKLGERLGGFDVVVVDGRQRVRCIKAIAEHVLPGGLLVLDNAERPHYQEAQDFLSSWSATRTSNGIWRTDLFRKA